MHMLNRNRPIKFDWTYKINGDMETYINNDRYVLSTTQKQNRIGETWNVYNLVVYTNDFKQLASVGFESFDSALMEITKIAKKLKGD